CFPESQILSLLYKSSLSFCVDYGRMVQCGDPGMSTIPVSVPANTFKLCLEKTRISRVPRAAFFNLSELRFLWLTYNSITSVHPSSFVNLKALRELRLDGNLLTAFPWEGLRDMPRLQTLVLHNNRLSSLPPQAALFLPNITYLDLSSNRWVTLLFIINRLKTFLRIKLFESHLQIVPLSSVLIPSICLPPYKLMPPGFTRRRKVTLSARLPACLPARLRSP
uniref:Uncharacterized protein n=1 Tax=Oryzias latipes TaxID=8090 RepID=A0A3P9M3N8_ORYLA